MISKRHLTFSLLFIFISAILILFFIKTLKNNYTHTKPITKVASIFKNNKKLIDFKLNATDGKVFSAKSLRGHWTLLFFGYTKCPDICPRTLGVVRDTWQIFKNQNQPLPVRFVFADISNAKVDLNELGQFVHNYDSEFIGVTGSILEMQALSDQLGIYTKDTEQGLDHTAALLLIDPQGTLHATITPPFNAEELAHDLKVLAL